PPARAPPPDRLDIPRDEEARSNDELREPENAELLLRFDVEGRELDPVEGLEPPPVDGRCVPAPPAPVDGRCPPAPPPPVDGRCDADPPPPGRCPELNPRASFWLTRGLLPLPPNCEAVLLSL